MSKCLKDKFITKLPFKSALSMHLQIGHVTSEMTSSHVHS